jgi:hypothetical protein
MKADTTVALAKQIENKLKVPDNENDTQRHDQNSPPPLKVAIAWQHFASRCQ